MVVSLSSLISSQFAAPSSNGFPKVWQISLLQQGYTQEESEVYHYLNLIPTSLSQSFYPGGTLEIIFRPHRTSTRKSQKI